MVAVHIRASVCGIWCGTHASHHHIHQRAGRHLHMTQVWEETQDLLDTYHLPELPEESEAEDARQLVIFREAIADENIALGDPVSLDDAIEYASRDDTRGTDI